MSGRTGIYEARLLGELREGSQSAFSTLFDTYYRDMVLFCGTFIGDQTACEDIVQSIFLRIWNDRRELEIETSLKSYLLRAVRNSCLDEFRHRKVVRNHVAAMTDRPASSSFDTEDYVLYSDLSDNLDTLMERLPATYREAFRMNRFENLKYKEIAQRLNVSERTVEVRIGKALEYLRRHLKSFALLISIWIVENGF